MFICSFTQFPKALELLHKYCFIILVTFWKSGLTKNAGQQKNMLLTNSQPIYDHSITIELLKNHIKKAGDKST